MMIFSIFRFFCTRFSNIVQTIHQWKYDLFSFQMMHKSHDPYDWFCAPGSHLQFLNYILGSINSSISKYYIFLTIIFRVFRVHSDSRAHTLTNTPTLSHSQTPIHAHTRAVRYGQKIYITIFRFFFRFRF